MLELPALMRTTLPHAILLLAVLPLTASVSHAAVKAYSADANNGTAGDATVLTETDPPIITEGALQGHYLISDDAAGTVTLDDFMTVQNRFSNFGPDILTSVLGPGAFFFAELSATITISGAKESNSSGVGAHGPSGTAAAESAEWGVVSGFQITGSDFCISSPILVCNQNGFAHGQTVPSAQLGSSTYDLGTWNFDAVGDMEAAGNYITRTASGGTSNVNQFLRGSLHGASIPALPLVGLGALAVAIAVAGARAAAARK